MLKLKIGRSRVADAPSPTNISENPSTKKNRAYKYRSTKIDGIY